MDKDCGCAAAFLPRSKHSYGHETEAKIRGGGGKGKSKVSFDDFPEPSQTSATPSSSSLDKEDVLLAEELHRQRKKEQDETDRAIQQLYEARQKLMAMVEDEMHAADYAREGRDIVPLLVNVEETTDEEEAHTDDEVTDSEDEVRNTDTETESSVASMETAHQYHEHDRESSVYETRMWIRTCQY
jgi:hypothetical protein